MVTNVMYLVLMYCREQTSIDWVSKMVLSRLGVAKEIILKALISLLNINYTIFESFILISNPLLAY